MRAGIIFAVAAAAFAAPAAGQNAAVVAAAKQAGVIGERFDGYVGFVTTPSAEVRRQAGAVNLRRRNLYIDLAARRNVSAQVVGIATACEIFPRVGVGEFYMLGDGVWRKRMPRQAVPLAGYCGR